MPITEKIPKALIPVLSKPLIEYILDLCVPHVSGIVIVINDSLGYKIKESYGDNYKDVPVSYAVQKSEDERGTLSALKCALPFIDTEKFVVCNADDLYSKEDIDNAFKESEFGAGLSMGEMKYYYNGIDVLDGYIKGFRRHPEQVELVKDKFINGFYILNRQIFDFTPVILKDGEASLPHTLFANLDKFPLKEIIFSSWTAVDSLENIKKAEDFIQKHYK